MKVCIALPSTDFDPTESGVPYEVLSGAGHQISFATPDGKPGRADPRMVEGHGLGPWRPILMANREARRAYQAMERSRAFREPVSYAAMQSLEVDAIVLPGGHAQGMRSFLESPVLRAAVGEHLRRELPLGAICHGVLVVARTLDPNTGRSVLFGRRTTALLESMEMSAWAMTCAWLGNYYRTYPETVEHEVRRALASPDDFVSGPFAVTRDSCRSGGQRDQGTGFVVTDGAYVSARWPGDAYTFAHRLASML